MVSKIRISNSISNFKERLSKRLGKPDWHWLRDRNEDTLFVGLYHFGDYLRLLWHRGPKKVFFCGSDIKSLERSRWKNKIAHCGAEFYCENSTEFSALIEMGIAAKITPMIFDNVKPETHFVPSSNPHVYMTTHPDRNLEYGVPIAHFLADQIRDVTFHVYGVKGPSTINLIYHGQVPHEQFIEEIKSYHSALRYNYFDGMAETVARSVLMGQYPISWIGYDGISKFNTTSDLVKVVEELKNKKEPNSSAQALWAERFEKSLCELLS